MNKRSLGALIALNVALLAAVVVTSLPGTAQGQAPRARGDYMMLSGETLGTPNAAVVYIMETRSQKLLAFYYSQATNKITVIDGRTVSDDVNALPR